MKLFLLFLFTILKANANNSLQIKNDTCLLFFESLYQKKKWSCSGGFLNKQYIVTAAHCAKAFKDTHYKLNQKNKISGYCQTNKKQIKLKIQSFHIHPKYSFDDITSRAYDIALVKIAPPKTLSLTSEYTLEKSLVQKLIQKNQCYITGYKDTLSESANQKKIKTPPDFIYLKSLHKKGIKLQNKFKNNKAIIHGGLAEKRLTRSFKNSLKLEYPGLGYSGSILFCLENQKPFKVGIYVGGFQSSKTWVSLLFLNEISNWLKRYGDQG